MNEVYLCDGEYFWTGQSWTRIRQFAKKYDIREALDITLKRFMNREPNNRVRVRPCRDFKDPKPKMCELSHAQRRHRLR